MTLYDTGGKWKTVIGREGFSEMYAKLEMQLANQIQLKIDYHPYKNICHLPRTTHPTRHFPISHFPYSIIYIIFI